jgi:Fe-S oxidoreductase
MCHVCLSVCPVVLQSAWKSSAPTGRIFMKFHVWGFFFQKSAERIQVLLKFDKNNGHFLEDLRMYIYDNISLNLLRMKNVSDKSCRENKNTHFIFNNFFPKIVLFVR